MKENLIKEMAANNSTKIEIAKEKKLLDDLIKGQDLLKLPLQVKEEGKGNKSEAHLLNKHDSSGGLPEYNPYSLLTYGFIPLANW